MELEKRVENLEKAVEILQGTSLTSSENKNNSELLALIQEHFSNLKPRNLVILLLHYKSMTISELKSQFETLGATPQMIRWFRGGNLKQRLVDKGIVYKHTKGKNPYFSLTQGTGYQEAEKIIRDLRSES